MITYKRTGRAACNVVIKDTGKTTVIIPGQPDIVAYSPRVALEMCMARYDTEHCWALTVAYQVIGGELYRPS